MKACTRTKLFRSVTFGVTATLLSSAGVAKAQAASHQDSATSDSAAESLLPRGTTGPVPTAVTVQTLLASAAELPDAPRPAGYFDQAADQTGTAAVAGSVTDVNGNKVGGANVTLQHAGSRAVRTAVADEAGSFRLDGLAVGTWTLTVSAPGFADGVVNSVTTVQGVSTEVKNIALRLEGTSTSVEVNLSQHEIAEEQLKDQEKQRVLGIVPNFYVSYVANAAPLSAGQKLKLAARTLYDPAIFAGAAFRAGIQQARETYPSLGQDAEGYGERFGIAYGSRASSLFLGRAVFPVLFRQDPRYFFQGTGTIKSRALHAASSPFYCKSDRGKFQPCYSSVLGTIAAAEVSNSFIPAVDRKGAEDVFTNALIGMLGSAGRALVQEFILPKLTRGRRHASTASTPKP